MPAVLALRYCDGEELLARPFLTQARHVIAVLLQTVKNLTKGNIFAFATVTVSYEEKRIHREFVQTNNANVIDKVRKTSES